MGRSSMCLVFLVLIGGGVAQADKGDEPPIHFEVGLNTRHFTAVEGDENAAFRGEAVDPSAEAQTAVSIGLRFTRWLPRNLYAGLEGEIGKLDAYDHSNLAGAYALFGARGQVGFASLFVEMAAGQRRIRFGDGAEEDRKMIAEPRVRGEMWLSSRITLSTAMGTTLGSRDVWMAGVYVGVHSLVWGKSQP
jgi:hypothetical protein